MKPPLILLPAFDPRAIIVVAMLLGAPASAQPKPDKRGEESVQLSAFIVTETRRHEYMATNSGSATRVNLPLKEVPFNLQVITSEMIEDTAAFASSYSRGNGAQREAVSWSGSVDDKWVRGFNTRGFLRSGFLRYADSSAFNIERVDIIKGPIAILDGITSPGGVMNVITKRPEIGKDFLRTKLVLGSAPYDRFAAMMDFNGDAGPAREQGRMIGYRFIGAYEYQSYGTRYGGREVTTFSPSILLRPANATTILLDYERWQLNGQRDNEPHGRQATVSDVPLAAAFGAGETMSWGGPDESYQERA